MRAPFSAREMERIRAAYDGDLAEAVRFVPNYFATDIASKLGMEGDELRVEPWGNAVPFRSDAERNDPGDLFTDKTLAELFSTAMVTYAEYRLGYENTDAGAVDVVYQRIKRALSDEPGKAQLAIDTLESAVDKDFERIIRHPERTKAARAIGVTEAARIFGGAGVQHDEKP